MNGESLVSFLFLLRFNLIWKAYLNLCEISLRGTSGPKNFLQPGNLQASCLSSLILMKFHKESEPK